ncbi:S26 family signal peptidase [Rhodanobacter denitrificans]|uniref:S26 family signal peptidase n=1 Tax=Rhodanobacter denitrificans TaxID=666685 RepID=UPI001F48A7C8|nr:S26 family signal peptidase [Rhodanobacter denitrificans]UJJ60572.1 S26 family signal peptidase [Rhodanobacter denitrificans]
MNSTAELEKPRWSRRKAINLTCLVAIAWIALIETVGAFVHLGYDPQVTRCLPWKVYAVGQHRPDAIEAGSIYVYRAHRIPLMREGSHVIKYAAAVAGDRVHVDAAGIAINGRYWGPLNPSVMEKGKVGMTDVTKDYTVPNGYVLMLGTQPRSWDGRYWGLLKTSLIVARARPLW